MLSADIVNASDPEGSDACYTPGLKLSARAHVPVLERLRSEGALHGPGVMNAGTEIWLTGPAPTPEQVAILVSQAFYQTTVGAMSFAPEFTLCQSCGAASRGLVDECPSCASRRVDGYALSGDRYSLVSGWDAGLRTELATRHRGEL